MIAYLLCFSKMIHGSIYFLLFNFSTFYVLLVCMISYTVGHHLCICYKFRSLVEWKERKKRKNLLKSRFVEKDSMFVLNVPMRISFFSGKDLVLIINHFIV